MAGHFRYTALLDACVLFPILSCDALISVAVTGIYTAKWSAQIDAEWVRNLAQYKQKPESSFLRRRDEMRSACPDWEVPEPAWRPLASSLDLPDDGDRHVLAAALAGHADCIVTANLRHFPEKTLAGFGLEVLHPDDFLHAQLELDPIRVLPAFKGMRARRQNPAWTAEAMVASFAKCGLVKTAEILRKAMPLI